MRQVKTGRRPHLHQAEGHVCQRRVGRVCHARQRRGLLKGETKVRTCDTGMRTMCGRRQAAP